MKEKNLDKLVQKYLQIKPLDNEDAIAARREYARRELDPERETDPYLVKLAKSWMERELLTKEKGDEVDGHRRRRK